MKFRIKVMFCMIALMSVLFGIGGSSLISLSFQNALRQEEKSAIASYQMILNTLWLANNMESWYTQSDISKILNQLSAQKSNWSAIRLTSDEKNIYSQGEYAGALYDLSDRADMTHCVYTVVPISDELIYLQVSGSFSIGYTPLNLDVAFDISSVYETYLQQQRIYVRIFLLLLFLCAVFSYILSYFLTRPLMKLSKASKEIAEGNYKCRSNIRTSDEIGTLSKEFDQMTDHLLYHIEELGAAMERQEQFIGSFTHELKTPMTSIIGYSDLLRSKNLSKEDALNAANYIFSEGKRLERLSLTLLDILVADQKEIELTPASPAKLIETLAHYHKEEYAKQQIQLETQCEKGICLLEPDLITSLVINLMENARRAITENGKIRITCCMTLDGCRITVSDNGRGIPKESLAHITEAFYRADKSRSRAQGGAGLGLTLCEKIVTLHHGSISFESEENKGTIVSVELKGGRL